MKQILVIVPFPMSKDNLALRKQQLDAVQISEQMAFKFKAVKAAPKNYISEADMVLADVAILEAGQSAEKDGFDAVCVDTMSDSGVAALRSVLSIPVVGPGRASMLTALMLGRRFSILTMWKKWDHLYQKTAKDLGLQTQMASIRSIDVAPDNQALLELKKFMIVWEAKKPKEIEEIKEVFTDYLNENEIKMKSLALPLRILLTGTKSSPGIFEILKILGHEIVIKKIKEFIKNNEK